MASFDLVETDRPIIEAEEDRLGRRNFAAHAAKFLVRNDNEDPIIVGLYGPWGSGKTSILNLITKKIQEDSKVSVVHFNPWYFKGEIQLLEKFFEELAASLGQKPLSGRQEVTGALRKYLNVLKPALKVASYVADAALPGTGLAARALAEVANPAIEGAVSIADPVADAFKSEVSIEATRNLVSEKLKAANIRIVVLIDDIDRLYPDDIRTVFKLVRLVGDLPRISYLLSFDPDVIAHALVQSAGGEKSIKKGYEYLEKIVQVALPLPKARREDLRAAAFDGVIAILKKYKIEQTQEELERFANGWGMGIEKNVKTIRQVKRVLNAINFAVGLLKDEINITDLILFESLRVTCPSVIDAISKEPQLVLQSARETELGKNSWLDPVLLNHPDVDRNGIDEILSLLFPRLKRPYDDNIEVQWRQEKRISSGEHLEKILCYGVPSGIVSDAVYDELIKVLRAFSSKEDARFNMLLEQIVKNSGWTDLIWRFRQDRKSLPQSAAHQIALVLAKNAARFSGSNRIIGDQKAAAYFVNEFISSANTTDEAKAFVTELISEASTVYFSALVLLDVLVRDHEEKTATSAAKGLSDSAKAAFKVRISSGFDISRAIDSLKSDELLKVLYSWSVSIGRTAIDAVFEKWFSENTSNAKHLVAAIIPLHSPSALGLVFRSMGVEVGYTNLSSIVSSRVLASALGFDPNNTISDEMLNLSANLPHAEQAALLFLAFHQRFLKAKVQK